MAGPARTITPLPRRSVPISTARTVSDLGGRGRQDAERDMILAQALDGKLNNTGTLDLATGGATTTDIDDPRIGTTTIAWLVGLNQNGSASLPTISQAVIQPGKIRLTHAASALTRSIGYVLFGVVALCLLAPGAFAQSPSLIGIPQATNPLCAAGEYWLSVESGGAVWKKCANGVITDMDTTGGGGGGTSLDQAVGETDLRYDATQEQYYYDVDGDSTRDTDGTEAFLDLLTIEVPGDYDTIQAALDSDDCKSGTLPAAANQGCRIVASGTRAERVEIGGATSGVGQYSVVLEGKGSSGYGAGGTNFCALTLTGDGTLDHAVISIDNSIGVMIRNLCIDMNTAAANDPKYGILIGGGTTATTINKHVFVEQVSIWDQGAAGGAGIKLGNSGAGGFTSDTAFNMIRSVYMEGVRTCLEVDAIQTVTNHVENMNCASPTDSVGGILVTRGQLSKVDGFYMSTNAAISGQTGIKIMNNSLGISMFSNGTFEWDGDNGTIFRFDDADGTGNLHAQTIMGTRFNIQTIASVRHKCIDWDRQGTLNVIGNMFESDSTSSRTCEVFLRNADAADPAYVSWIGNDIEWNGSQPDMVFDESTAGGALVISRDEHAVTQIGQTGRVRFEGSTLDANETDIVVTNPTADRTMTIPNADSNPVIPTTCGGTDKVSAISSGGVVTCSADSGGGGGGNSVEQSITLSGGSGFFSQAVTGQSWVTTGSEIVCDVLGTTADGLTPEAISIGNLSFSVSDRVAGDGFTINVYSPNGLEGTIRAHCLGV